MTTTYQAMLLEHELILRQAAANVEALRTLFASRASRELQALALIEVINHLDAQIEQADRLGQQGVKCAGEAKQAKGGQLRLVTGGSDATNARAAKGASRLPGRRGHAD